VEFSSGFGDIVDARVVEIDLAEPSYEGLLEALEKRYPGVRRKLTGEDGLLKRALMMARNGKKVHRSRLRDLTLEEGDVIRLLIVLGGG
jgi:sulfur carrier protein ThiS